MRGIVSEVTMRKGSSFFHLPGASIRGSGLILQVMTPFQPKKGEDDERVAGSRGDLWAGIGGVV
jgi:hypothetical protein